MVTSLTITALNEVISSMIMKSEQKHRLAVNRMIIVINAKTFSN